ncbi:MAG: TonB-dependent receptor [Paludibacter sp.]|nr:TonB-dependent receptor [Paludibacter sp.]
MLKKSSISIFLFLFAITLSAQTLTGKVVDENTSLPIEFANVVLLQRSDSAFVAGAVTDSVGVFSIEAKQGDYLLKVSFMGYQTKFIDVNSANIGTIILSENEKELSEVTVTASRPIRKLEKGGISTDIQNSYLKNMGTAADVLGQLPFVNNSKGNITVFGKGTPLIYINNRLMRDNSELEQLNSDQIKKITIITNPGAEYAADVKSVIRIETIKQVGDGLSGNIMAGATKDKRFSHNESVNLNYRYGNLDVFGTFRYANNSDLQILKLSQITNSNDDIAKVTQNANQEMKLQNYYATIGMNYIFNKNHSAGIMFQNTGSFSYDFTFNSDFNAFENNVLAESFKSEMNVQNKPRSNYLNAYYEGNFTEWLSAKLNMDYAAGSGFSGQNSQNFRQDSTEIIHTENKNNYDLYAAKLILTSPIWKGELNYGYEFAKTINNQTFNILNAGTSELLHPSNNSANQLLNAAFITYSKEMGKFSASLAFRYEHIDFQYFANGIKENEPSKTYNKFFPSANISYQKDNLQMQLSYRNSTERPSYYQLRSEVQYDNPYLYEGGNPYLKPTIINTLSYMLAWKDLQSEIAYNFYKDRILLAPVLLTDNILFMQPTNLPHSTNFTITAAWSHTIKFWRPSLELALSKDNVKYGSPAIYYRKPIFTAKFKNLLTFPKQFWVGATFAYQSKGNSDIDYQYDSFQADVYLFKYFFDGKIRINLGANDIFGTYKSEFLDITNHAQSYIWKDLNTRNIYLSISYNFNSTRSKYKGEQASDELNRL